MSDRDYTSELQARVGCCHEVTDNDGTFEWCMSCGSRWSLGIDKPGKPDCATLWGALQAAKMYGVEIRMDSNDKCTVFVTPCVPEECETFEGLRGMDNDATETDAAKAVCRLVIDGIDQRSSVD